MTANGEPQTLLLLGASRGLGLALAEQYLERGRPGLRYLDYLGRTVPW